MIYEVDGLEALDVGHGRALAVCPAPCCLLTNFVPGLSDCGHPWVGNFPVQRVQQGNTGLAS